ncbi:hypothetical protein M514_28617, partial [Trichuris suis]
MKNTLLFLLTMCKHDITTGRKTAHIRNRWMEERKRTNAFLFFVCRHADKTASGT